jgi:hypothetical protein
MNCQGKRYESKKAGAGREKDVRQVKKQKMVNCPGKLYA